MPLSTETSRLEPGSFRDPESRVFYAGDGVYRALSGRRATRGMLRASAREDLPGFEKNDYLDEDEFWSQVENARERAATNAQRIRAGDVKHDPKGDGCPAWCDLWPICRVPRA